MESGIKKGFSNGIARHDKVQDPADMKGDRQALAYWVADIHPAPADGTGVGSVANLSGSSITLTAAGNAQRRRGCGNKFYIDNDDVTDRVYTSSTTGTRELTVMMVFRPSSTITADTTIFDRTGGTTQPGDINIYITGGNKIAARFNSSTSTTTYLRYETGPLRGYPNTTGNIKTGRSTSEWILMTVKFDMDQKEGRDIEIYINGTKNMNLINDTWNLAPGTNMQAAACTFGNANSGSNATNSGTHVAAGLVFDYWLSGADQLRIENFFRYYYGIRF